MERLFYCTESENVYTLDDLEKYRQIAIADGDTLFTDTLENFVKACSVDNNGTLIELRIVKNVFCNAAHTMSNAVSRSQMMMKKCLKTMPQIFSANRTKSTVTSGTPFWRCELWQRQGKFCTW
jgi:hypothetical protein